MTYPTITEVARKIMAWQNDNGGLMPETFPIPAETHAKLTAEMMAWQEENRPEEPFLSKYGLNTPHVILLGVPVVVG